VGEIVETDAFLETSTNVSPPTLFGDTIDELSE
jgi:hypothetical protein